MASPLHITLLFGSLTDTGLVGSSGGERADHLEALCEVDVVLTTYGVVAREYGVLARTASADPERDEGDDEGPAAEALRTSIFGVHFHRVVLDEAHMIKGRTTAVARGTRLCWAKRRRPA
jgi:SNF2 family DNA or RNA helicase